MTAPCILVIDDDPINQDVVKAIIKGLHYESVSATNGAKGLQSLAENKQIKAVLLDWNMPEMDGMETLSKIRQSKMSDIPVIMMTAEDTAAKVKMALKQGVDDYLVKPFDEQTLVNKLRGVLTGKSYRKDK